jgi:chromosome segregation ATPase
MSQSRTSGARSRRSEGQSKIERLNVEAEAILAKKTEELSEYDRAIEEAEKQLVKLKTELESKAAILSSETTDEHGELSDELEDDDRDLTSLKSAQDAEIQALKEKHEEEINTLRQRYSKALKDAEEWAEDHAETLFLEKTAELEELKKELDSLKSQANEAALSQLQTRTRLSQQSKSVSVQNAQRIQYLEAQLSEISSIAREELREVRIKIDECLSSVDLREREHKNEIEKYEREIAQREEQYNVHLQVMTEQFQNEILRLEQQLAASTSKGENLQRVLKQLEKHHQIQIETTRRDNERMKSTIYQAKSRDDQLFVDTRSYVSQIQTNQHDCRQLEQEIALVNNEISELQSENRELQAELQRLDGKKTTTRSRR